MNTASFLTRSHLSPNLAITIFFRFTVSIHTSIPKRPLPSPLLLFTPSLTTTTLYQNLPKSHITQLQQIQNSLPRAVVKAPKSSHITPILWSLQWLKITECIKYKLLSLTYKVLTTTQLSYLYNLITVSLLTALTLHLRSHLLVHLLDLLYIYRSFFPICFPSSLELTPGFSPSTAH